MTANATGYGLALINSFALNRTWTFRHTGSTLTAAVRFFCVFAVSYLVNLGTMTVLLDSEIFNSYVVHAVAAIPYTLCFYLGSRFFAFSGQDR